MIYRKDGIVNWSCELQSTISDIEIETREFNGLTLVPIPGHVQPVAFGQIYDFAYKSENGGKVFKINIIHNFILFFQF